MLPTTRWRSQPAMGSRSGNDVLLPFPESRLLAGMRPHLMLQGTQSSLEAAIVALTPRLRPPLLTWSEGCALQLPQEPRGTLVLREVGRLDSDDQRRLMDWLEIAAGRAQVISTTSEPLFALVERRAFLELLYYRLNILRIEV